ncbi:hypothetical protein AJ78_07771 [Emergomyces pasteurianus Ep9510]|uniref:Uncharacterized protein n=1 Tax=Emergomyces pasteurianus Ep9510 TaxID=1447872 RepID=A0A1J9P407_9EURO|nr:hypothetical protein AJ78_07771 [Emergomyces pasteurianus Ep9510]
MSSQTTQIPKIEESETGSVDSKGDGDTSSATALAESLSTIPFQQMYKPLSQEEMGYIRKRLEEYTDRVRRQTYILDNFDNAVILADARTLFSYIALLESTIKTQ